MISQFWWLLARSSGLVASALLTATVFAGVLLSGRLSGRRPGPAWVLDLHRGVASLSVVLTAVHVLALVADTYVEFGWAEVLVPMASQWRPGAVALGVVAFWALVLVQGSSLLRGVRVRGRSLPTKLWRRLHLLAYPAWLLVVGHLVTAGTDAGLPQVVAVASGAGSATLVAAVVRLTTTPRRGRGRTPRAASRGTSRPHPQPSPPVEVGAPGA